MEISRITPEMINDMFGKNLMNEQLCTNLDALYIGDAKCNGVYVIQEKQIGEKSGHGTLYQACCENDCAYVAKYQHDRKTAKREANIQFILSRHNLAPIVREVWDCDRGVVIIMDALSITVQKILTMLSKSQKEETGSYYARKIYSKLKELHDVGVDDIFIGEDIDIIELGDIVKDKKTTYEQLLKYRKYIDTVCDVKNIIPIEKMEVKGDDDQYVKTMRENIMDQVYNLINKLHQLNYVHLDTHLNNFMTDHSFEKVYMIDFGLAQISSDPEDREIDYKKIKQSLDELIVDKGYINLKYLEK